MSSNAAIAPFTVVVPNVAQLHDADLDIIVDMHIFGHDAWCNGIGVTVDGHFQYRCLQCGRIEVLSLSAILFQINEPHLRLVPQYTVDALSAYRIVKEIRARRKEVRLSFIWRLATLLAGQGYPLSALSKITPHMVAVAALQAIGVVDQAGYIIARREVAQ